MIELVTDKRCAALTVLGQFLYAKLVMENLLEQGSLRRLFEELGSDCLPKELSEA